MAVYYNYNKKRRDLVVNNSALFLVDPVFKYRFGDRLSSLQDFYKTFGKQKLYSLAFLFLIVCQSS
jgi:hypothetical protein